MQPKSLDILPKGVENKLKRHGGETSPFMPGGAF
jgi:hypothetical protein